MKLDIDKLTEKLSNLSVELSKDLFDNIYNQYNNKRKNRFVLWLFPTLMGLGIIFFTGYYINTFLHQGNNNTLSINKNTYFHQTKNKQEEELCPIISKEKQVNAIDDDDNNINRKEVSQTVKNIIANIDEKNTHSTKKSDFSFQKNNESYPLVISQINGQQTIKNNQEDNPLNTSNFNTTAMLYPQKKDDKLLQLGAPKIFLDIDRKISYPNISIAKKPPLDTLILPRFIIYIYTSAGAQQFCSFARARKLAMVLD